jgi:hypothetical protein
MKHLFLMTSATNTKFGVFSAEERIEQMLATIASIRQRAPGARIIMFEMAGRPLTEDQSRILTAQVDNLLDFTGDDSVRGLYDSTDNWDVVKNVTEVMCFRKGLKTLLDTEQLNDVDRIFKISGRYVLTDAFDIKFYEEYKTQPNIVVARRRTSQFPYAVTHVDAQFMSRLWSWPRPLTTEIAGAYDNILSYMYQRLAAGGYCDIEHGLYRFLDHNKVLEKDLVGITGNIGPNGARVED